MEEGVKEQEEVGIGGCLDGGGLVEGVREITALVTSWFNNCPGMYVYLC